ncbi:M60 family metallopeptidase [Lederbergia lenta]|uniref:M60 family metallopeptidase n=1 Tax=Lederbergia lenta TaxID=1467 RepID=UPI00203D5947|nr:M60 family metallopeptidase [Lederbergia lenta]MCM3110858.1 M60 family metallopeptidase [Lederbergia lenta]
MKKKWVTVMLAGSLIGSVAMPFTMGNHSYAFTLEKVDLAVQEQLREDLEVFYKGLKGFPTYSSSHAGGISAIGNNAFPVAINPDTIPFAGASRYGEGRVFAAGLSEYFDFSNSDPDKTAVLSNILKWVTGKEEIHADHLTYEDALDGKGKITLVTNREVPVSADLPINLEHVDNFLSIKLNPLKHQVIYVNNFHQPLSDAEVTALLAYVQQGGAVIFGEKGWVMAEHPKEWMSSINLKPKIADYGIQKLLNEVGLSLSNVIATTKTATLPLLPLEKIQNYYVPTLIDKAKAIEKGTLDAATLNIGPEGADATKKKEVIAQVVSGTVSSLVEEHPLLEQMKLDLHQLEITWPFVKSDYPYSSALLAYQVNEASLDVNGEKSQYADHFPGSVSSDATIIGNKEIEVDFDYQDLSHLGMAYPPGTWISTGLYAPAGETIEIDVPEGIEDLYVQVGSHTDVLTGKTTWSRMPIVAMEEKLKSGTNQIKSPYGGIIYLIPKVAKPGIKTSINVSGAVSTPSFVRGRTTNEEWHNSVKNNPAPWGELIGDHVIFTLPKESLLTMENPEALIEQWDEIAESYNTFVGIDRKSPLPHTGLDRQHRYVADVQISAGYMHAGYPMMIPIDPAASHVVDPNLALVRGWGFWHEMGHEYQQNAWKWGDITEVSVNIYTLYIQEKFTDVQRLLQTSDDGKSHYDRAMEFVTDSSTSKKFTDIDGMDQLVFFKQLQLAYGWDFYTDLHIAYREMDSKDIPTSDQQKKDMLLYMTSKVSGHDLVPFYQKWGWSITDEAIEKVRALHLPTPTVPIENLRELPVETVNDLIRSVEQFEKEEEFKGSNTSRSLKVHLTAVSHYEEQGADEKLVKHMEGFKLLLDQQKEKELISERAYKRLKADADLLLMKWQ